MKAIMYHYVRAYDRRYPYFKNLHIDDFKRQLDYFETQYGFVSYEQFCNALLTGVIPTGVVLTFDDGLKDHYQYVLPVLVERGLWGIFYVPTMFYQHHQFLDVHKIHLLLGKYKGQAVYAQLRLLINDDMLTHGHVKEFKELTYSNQVNDDYTKLVKRTLNYFISYEYRHEVLNTLMNYFFPDKEEIAASFYLSPQEIKTMQAAGMIIGSHTITHPVMSKLSVKEQKEEIERSFNFLEHTIGSLRIKTFCYPYGGFHSFTSETEQLLTKNHCAFSFNVEHRDIDRNDVLYRPQALPRYDCNEFPFGKCRDAMPVGLNFNS